MTNVQRRYLLAIAEAVFPSHPHLKPHNQAQNQKSPLYHKALRKPKRPPSDTQKLAGMGDLYPSHADKERNSNSLYY